MQAKSHNNQPERKARVNSLWLQGEDPQSKENLTKSLLGGTFVLDKLYKICYNRSVELKKVNKTDYDSPSWAHKQAHLNGQLEELELILSLINPNHNDK